MNPKIFSGRLPLAHVLEKWALQYVYAIYVYFIYENVIHEKHITTFVKTTIFT